MRITFEGEALPARPGQSLAAALAEAGHRDLRDTRSGEGRGLFCGMGACQDCVVVVDGVANTRACMTKPVDGMQVQRQPHPAPLPQRAAGTPPLALDDLPEATPDLLVIGGGAGGLTAALTARRAGLDVLLVDERSIPGGQYYKQAAESAPLDAQQRDGAALLQAVREAGVRIQPQTEIWGAFAPLLFLATQSGRTQRIRPRAAILATGAQERALPFPGWTLPGVMTTGAAQTLWRSYRTLPGRRIVVAGNGPLNLQVALELAAGGAEVLAVAEASTGVKPRALARMLAAAPLLAAKGVAMLAKLRRRGIPLLRGALPREVKRQEGALHVELTNGTRFTTDVLLCGFGFQPETALLRMLGAEHDLRNGLLLPRRDAEMRTNIPHLYAVGDATGLGGAPAACAEGEIAALSVARLLGCSATSDSAARTRLARHRAFQAALWDVFAAPFPGLALATPETLLCRCEEVTLGMLDAALAAGPADAGEIKRRTRCGMGRCQGRYCAPLLAERMGETALFAPRAPARPVRIADLVAGSAP